MSTEYPVDNRGYVGTAGAAQYLALSESYLNKARHYGNGPAYVKVGTAVRYSFAALDAWVADSTRTVTEKKVRTVPPETQRACERLRESRGRLQAARIAAAANKP